MCILLRAAFTGTAEPRGLPLVLDHRIRCLSVHLQRGGRDRGRLGRRTGFFVAGAALMLFLALAVAGQDLLGVFIVFRWYFSSSNDLRARQECY